ncbi:glycosyltransferase family 9 protein, partial [Acidobacteria bacterium AH-259-D05]|nr:glycosyltransferase family 9 protein [Acidobacteria bacterium AH-259-D05]
GSNSRELDAEDSVRSRVLFTRLRSLGDTVLMTPILTVMKRVPGWQVGVVIETPYEQILEGNPDVDRVFVIDNLPNKWMARLQVIREIRAFNPTLAIDLHGGTTSAFLTALSGASKRVGYLQSRNSYLYNVKIPDSQQVWGREHVHTVEHQLSIVKYLGFPVEPIPPPQVPIAAEDLESIKDLLAHQGADEGFILIHPAAAFDTKQWDAEKFASLATRLVETDHQVVMTAGPGEESLLEKIRQSCSAQVRFIPPQPIRKFSALSSLCTLYVGNDTGSTHIVAALGKKIVVIFGSSDFKVWYPWGTEHQLIRSDLPCMPCPGYFCLHYDEPLCIRSISVEPVLEAVQSLL